MRTYYIYTLTDPRDNVVRYVGCTQNPKARFSAHKNASGFEGKKRVAWQNELKAVGLCPIMHIISTCNTFTDAIEAEIRAYDQFSATQLTCTDPRKNKYADNFSRIEMRKNEKRL